MESEPLESKKQDSLTSSFTAVGLSRQHTAENRRPGGPKVTENGTISEKTRKTVDNDDFYGLDSQKTITNGTNGRLFTEDELANAMKQSTLKPSQMERA